MSRVYNFSAGPAILPKAVLEEAQQELLDYDNTGMSVMELSHRSSTFQAIIEEAEKLFRELLAIPSNYQVLFLQGGASLQFTMTPLNLRKSGRIGFIDTGSWSTKAIKEVEKLNLTANILASSKDNNYQSIPKLPSDYTDYDYIHITSNNTIEGTQYQEFPDTGKTPLVADMSSDILSRAIDVSKFGLIYAGAQKNMGPAGLTIVIIKEDLIGLQENLPSMLDYKTHADKNSLYNTPPTFAIYMANLVFKWIHEQGGIANMEALNQKKAAILYNYLDQSHLFNSPVDEGSRSVMNIPFVTGNDDLDKEFIEQANQADFVNIKGHRSVGGMRASLYNAFPIEGVSALVEFMERFEQEKG